MNSWGIFGISAIFAFFFVMQPAFAEPLDEIVTNVLDVDGQTATVKINWNHDDSVSNYKVGCVSCMPNFSENTTIDEIILYDVASFANGNALLYIIAYAEDEIISAEQVILNFN
ncbi:MAG: hypothetical protein ACW9W4_10455 [Candidatus Nitrosopumilus sp. bin_7KS]